MRKALICVVAGSLGCVAAHQALANYDDADSSEYMNTSLDLARMKQQVEIDRCDACWITGFGFGAAWTSVQNNPVLVPNGSGFAPPSNVDQYTVGQVNSTPALTVFGGYRWAFRHSFPHSVMVGLRYQYIVNAGINGNVIQYSLPAFNNYTYKVDVSSSVFTLFSKMEPMRWGDFAPFLSVGLGMAINGFDSYSEAALPGVTPRVSPGFKHDSQYAFAYQAGFGLDYYVRRLVILSAGYEYLHLGTLTSGSGTQLWSGTSLNYGDYNAHTLLFSASYIFN